MSKQKEKKKPKSHPKVMIEKLSQGYLLTIIEPTGEETQTFFGPQEDRDVTRMAVMTLADVTKELSALYREPTNAPLLGIDP